MTARQIFEYALVELNKVQAPSLLLEDYNYFINKAVNQYINKIYNSYEVNQQKSDDLRVLKGTTILPVRVQDDYISSSMSQVPKNKLFGATYETYLPDDYLHILNCIAEFEIKKTFKCYDIGDRIHFGAKKLTSDMFSQIINNFYMKPSYKSPYFFINNVNTSNTFPVIDNQSRLFTDAPSLKDAISIQSPEGYIYGEITPGIYRCSSRNHIKAKSNAAILELGTLDNFTNVLVPSTRFSGEQDNLCALISDTSTYFTELGIDKHSLILGSYPAIGEEPAFIGIYDIVIDKLLINGKEAIILDYDSLRLNEDLYNMLYYVNPPQIEFAGYELQLNTSNKVSEVRYGNKSKVRMEIRYGKDNNLFELKQVYVDYLKAPQFIRITQTQVDEVEDNSQIIEFPDYVCQEIVNELIKLLMENASDPRLQTNIPINQSIANPQQEQQQKR